MESASTRPASPADGASDERGLGSWILLFGSLAASAGHGLFVFALLTVHRPWPNFKALLRDAGTTGTTVLCWFMLCVPLAALAFVLRRWLQQRAWLGAAAMGAAIGAVGSLAYYALMMAGR